jgi:uncharacterized protein RhaS with RHS repeats
MKIGIIAIASGMLALSSFAHANEIATYTYDHRGRLVKVVRSGTINNTVTTEYTYDKADNREKEKTTNSPNPPPP